MKTAIEKWSFAPKKRPRINSSTDHNCTVLYGQKRNALERGDELTEKRPDTGLR
ncbi:predicted protein [Plenodomus lingam JN3]|uniref:Uncharacterized protein n=1 Tax=Leptosphaeria maculans (strain JN3 / isolate v23.1.3 / race Av1-4-5-6-7-8) TaxID=985895 RepID=E5A6N8_LEPMJ|nr:predicted protein [Plenodomus lingam JN3]CBX99283.1 predicted protein [Plenodomus lingam JN3]